MSEEPDVLIHKENIISHKTSNITKEYTFGKVIGTGSYGQVRLAVHRLTKQVRAVKIIQKAKVNINAL